MIGLKGHQQRVNEILLELEVNSDYYDQPRKAISFLLEASPDLLNRIIAQIKRSQDERDLWITVFRETLTPSVGESHQKYLDAMTKYLEVGALAISIRSKTARNQVSVKELFLIINNKIVRELCNWDESKHDLRKAAMVVAGIAIDVEDVVPTDIELLRESMEYTLNHMDEVEALMPELIKRRFIKKEQIALMVEKGVLAMASGIL